MVFVLRIFAHGFDAFGAEGFLNSFAAHIHGNFLQIRFELAIGRVEGMAAAAPEEGPLAAIFTSRHVSPPVSSKLAPEYYHSAVFNTSGGYIIFHTALFQPSVNT